jgi:hypothetical protein
MSLKTAPSAVSRKRIAQIFRQKCRVEWLATPERRQKRPTLGCPFERNGRIGGQSGRGGHYIRKRNGSGSSLCRRTRKACNLPMRCLSSRVRFLCRFSDQIYVTGHPATANSPKADGGQSRQGPSHLTHRDARVDFDPRFRCSRATRAVEVISSCETAPPHCDIHAAKHVRCA